MTSRELRARLRLWRTLFVHRWHAAQTLGEALGAGDALGRRFEHINHARSLGQYVWLHGAFREADNGGGRVPVEGPGLGTIIEPLTLHGRHGLEAAIKLASGEPANTPLATRPEVQKCARDIVTLHRAMLDYYVQMEWLTTAEAAQWKARPMPLLRPLLTEDGNEIAEQHRPDPSEVGDLVAVLRGAFAANIYYALSARARAELFRVIEAHPQGHRFAEPASRRQRDDVHVAMQAGVRRRWHVRDPALASMLASVHEPPMPPLMRALAGVRTAVSAMITAMPVFVVKNFFRDTLAGFVAGRYWQVPFLGTLAGSCQAVADMAGEQNAAMRDYLLQGGFYSGLVEAETDFAPTRAGPNRWATPRRWWSQAVHWATRPAWIAEAGTRLNQFQKAKAAGAQGYEASRAARMVSSDFANIGSARMWRMYVHTVPFLNAALQGLDQLYQIARRPAVGERSADQQQHVWKTLAAGGLMALASVFVWGWNTSSPERRAAYEGEAEWSKAAWVTLYDVGGADVRLPVPFQIGATFIKVPEAAFDLMGGIGTVAGPRFAWELVHGNLWMGWKPAVVAPLIDIYTNRNYFGGEIIPGYMANWRPAQKKFRSTAAPYVAFGEAFNVSPLHVQTIWRGYTGHLGTLVATALDEAAWDDGARPFPRAGRMLIGIYGVQSPRPPRTRWPDEFYRLADWADDEKRAGVECPRAPRRSSTSRAPRRSRRTRFGEPVQTAAPLSPVCMLDRATNSMASRATAMRRQAEEARRSPTLPRAAKEATIARIHSEMDAEFRAVVETLGYIAN